MPLPLPPRVWKLANLRAIIRAARAPQDDVIGQLERLGRLKEQGILTDEEFQAQKQLLLGVSPESPERYAPSEAPTPEATKRSAPSEAWNRRSNPPRDE